MLLHASAFVLYLLSVLVLLVFSTIMGAAPSDEHLHWLQTAVNISIWCDFVSQMLLIGIFWDLAKADDVRGDTQTSTTRFSSIQIDEFDDEAELQARIWNRFQREEREGAGHGLTVTSSSMMMMKNSRASLLGDKNLSAINDV